MRHFHPCLKCLLQVLKMSENMIDSVTEETLRGCSNLRLLDLSQNQLQEQSIPANAWSHLKYVRPSVRPSNHQKLQFVF